jgi:hypothetical protein
VIFKSGDTVESQGGEYQSAALVVEVDIANLATVNATKEGRGYVVYNSETYRIDSIVDKGPVRTNRIRLLLERFVP